MGHTPGRTRAATPLHIPQHARQMRNLHEHAAGQAPCCIMQNSSDTFASHRLTGVVDQAAEAEDPDDIVVRPSSDFVVTR